MARTWMLALWWFFNWRASEQVKPKKTASDSDADDGKCHLGVYIKHKSVDTFHNIYMCPLRNLCA